MNNSFLTGPIAAAPSFTIAAPHGMPGHIGRLSRSSPRKIKVLLYSHDTFGLGHLRRNLAIADRLLAQQNQFSVRLLTGSPVISTWSLPRGLQVHPMPPVVKDGAERYRSRDPRSMFALTKGYREALIVKSVLNYRPDIVLVDHAPAGMNGELLAALSLIRRELPGTRTILGLRDILDAPHIVKAVWAEQEIPTLLDQAYDEIFVYGSQALFDVSAGYGLTGRIADAVRYCGHVVAAPDAPCRTIKASAADRCWSAERAAGRKVVLVTAGGGGDGFFLMDAYLQALSQLPLRSFYSAIVTGPLMDAEHKAALRAAAENHPDIELIDHTTNLMPSLRAADLVVAMAGYNTSAEIIATRTRAILVPRAAPRAEQLIRASLLAGLGVVDMIVPGPDLADNLARALPKNLTTPPPDPSLWASLDLNGAERVAAHLTAMIPSLLGRTL
ncbi:MAG TPA: glycosyltransferase [Acidiphilium sp.]|nr:glycosyltransferase [Acidiphilium sp.]HQU24810.1 glycosyltransferase [Acidiphilium sp.]